MLAPDLLDRRALAWLRPVDIYGRAVTSGLRVVGEGVRSIRKKDGTIAVLAADGFEDYAASFLTPASPAVGSQHVPLDIQSASDELAARRYHLRLPREPDPAKADEAPSLFQSVPIEMLPGAAARLTGSACALRVTVQRKSDKKLVENALVRAQSNDGHFAGRGVSDSRGQAVLIFASLPVAFPGAGANLRPDIEVKVVVTADAGLARFNTPGTGIFRRPAPPFVDPDELSATPADFSAGTAVTISSGRNVSLTIDWTKP